MAQRAPMNAILTIEEFEAYPYDEGKAELVRGELLLSPGVGGAHGAVASNILSRLVAHVTTNRLGQALVEVAFVLVELPRTVRVPDVSFVRAERLPSEGLGLGFLVMTPDLAVEILSPSESASRLQEKLDDYRVARTPLIWVVDPRARTVMIIEGDETVVWLHENDTLTGGTTIAGFSCAVADLFVGVAR